MNFPIATAPLISILVLIVVYGLLIREKINKVLVVSTGALALIVMQVFKTSVASSQSNALAFIAHNLDMLGFILGMMVLVGIVKESGFFEFIAISLIKLVKGRPIQLLIVLGLFTLGMTVILPNIIAVLIVTPILVILIKEFNFTPLPYFLVMITMANIGGATTPISDPTTYYMAKTAGLSFMEVAYNSGFLVLVLSTVSMLYVLALFWKPLKRIKIKKEDIAGFDPKSAIKDKKILFIGIPILFVAIAMMALKDFIAQYTHVSLDDTSIAISAALLCVLTFKVKVEKIYSELIDWEILFFFMGLFVIVGALQHTGVVNSIGDFMVDVTHGDITKLILMIAMGSGMISTFIDNVPYNIAMIAAIQSMAANGIFVYPLWWALNLGTSLGGAGSPIGAACNVVALAHAEREHIRIKFIRYFAYAFPLVIINGLVTSGILYLRYG
jgi:Na+/H+ antiporter NhaD/arsenite permease-like protein